MKLYKIAITLLLPILSGLSQADQTNQDEDNLSSEHCGQSMMSLEYGQNIVCSTESNDEHEYSFNGESGDEIRITIAEFGPGSPPIVRLYDVNGGHLLTIQGSYNNGFSSTNKKYLIRYNDQYTIKVSDSDGGQYRLQLDSYRTAENDIRLNYGVPHVELIDYEGDADYFSFLAKQGTSVKVSLEQKYNLASTRVKLYRPDGNSSDIIIISYNSDEGSEEIELFEDGQYFLEITDTETGRYEVKIECISEEPCPENRGEIPHSLDFRAGMAHIQSNEIEGTKELCRLDPSHCGISLAEINENMEISIPYFLIGNTAYSLNLEYLNNGLLEWKYKSHAELE